MTFAITAPYAAALSLLFVVLTLLVIRPRVKQHIGLGDGGSVPLLAAIRRQANFVENVPLTLLLMALAEAGGAGEMTLNLSGAALLIARLIHPFGILPDRPAHPARLFGAVLTTLVQLAMVVLLAMQYFT